MSNSIMSVTLTKPDLTLTDLVMYKSTAATAVIFGMLALLFDMLESFSLLVTTTTLEMLPAEMTSAAIINCLQSPLVKLPIYQTPSSTS